MNAQHTPNTLYADRDIVAQGAVYVTHVMAMAKEGLHEKSDIAAELAHRDILCADLLAALKAIMEMLDDEIKTATDEELSHGLSDPQCQEHIKKELACVIACRAAIAKAEGGAA